MVTPHSKPVTSAIAGPRQQGSPVSRRAAVLQDCTRSQTRPAREPTHHETQQPPREIAETKWSEDRPCTHRGHRETARMEVGFFDANGILDKTITPTVCKPRAGHNARRSPRTAIIPRGWSGAGKEGTASSRSARIPGTEEWARPTRSHGRDGVPAVREERQTPGPAPNLQGEPIGECPFDLRQVGMDRVLTVRKSAGRKRPCPSHDPTGGVAAVRGLCVPPPLADPDPTLDPGPPALSIRPHITCTPNLPHPDKPPSGINKNCLTVDLC